MRSSRQCRTARPIGCSFLAGPGLDTGLVFEPLFIDAYCLILPPDHVLAAEQQVTRTALKPHKVITAQLPPGRIMRPLIEPRATRSIGPFRRRNRSLAASAWHFLATARRTAGALRDPAL